MWSRPRACSIALAGVLGLCSCIATLLDVGVHGRGGEGGCNKKGTPPAPWGAPQLLLIYAGCSALLLRLSPWCQLHPSAPLQHAPLSQASSPVAAPAGRGCRGGAVCDSAGVCFWPAGHPQPGIPCAGAHTLGVPLRALRGAATAVRHGAAAGGVG